MLEVFSEKVSKQRFFSLSTIIYSKINMNVAKKKCLGNNLPTHIKENPDFPWQLLSAKANFEG